MELRYKIVGKKSIFRKAFLPDKMSLIFGMFIRITFGHELFQNARLPHPVLARSLLFPDKGFTGGEFTDLLVFKGMFHLFFN